MGTKISEDECRVQNRQYGFKIPAQATEPISRANRCFEIPVLLQQIFVLTLPSRGLHSCTAFGSNLGPRRLSR